VPEQKWLWFDVDDVFVDFASEVHASLTRMTGIHIPVEDWSTPEWPRLYGNDFDAMRAFWIADQTLERCQFYPESESLLRKFQDDGFSIGLITARGWHPSAEEETLASFAKIGVVPDALVIVRHGESKADILASRGEHIVSFLEDSPVNARDCQAVGIPSTLLTRPWNADVVDVPRISSLADYYAVVAARNAAHTGPQLG
jgi:hypothetical protein